MMIRARVHLNSSFARGLLRARPDVKAVTIGGRIFVPGTDLPGWALRHEMRHVEQYARFGVVGFLVRYVWYRLRYGYDRNPLERDAELAE